MGSDVRPYFVPEPDAIVWGPWSLHDGLGWSELPEAVEGWDPAVDLQVARQVWVDPVRFRQQCGLDPDLVAVVVSWTSSTTDMTESVPPVRLGVDGTAVVEARLIGERLSGTLTLTSTISLVRQPEHHSAGMAAIPGSILAEDVRQLTLENVSSMFPVHEIDFAKTRLSPAASWHLETSTELSAPFYANFRVLINKKDTELCSAVSRGAKDKRQQAILDELEAGVSTLLLELALNLNAELEERDEWPLDSVGDILGRLVDGSNNRVVAPAAAHDLADLRTQLSGMVRASGRGRLFQ